MHVLQSYVYCGSKTSPLSKLWQSTFMLLLTLETYLIFQSIFFFAGVLFSVQFKLCSFAQIWAFEAGACMQSLFYLSGYAVHIRAFNWTSSDCLAVLINLCGSALHSPKILFSQTFQRNKEHLYFLCYHFILTDCLFLPF